MLPAIVCNRPFTRTVAERLASCVAYGLETPTRVAEDLGIAPAALISLMENDDFQEIILEARARWNDPNNAAQRTRVKADIILEDALPRLDALIHAGTTSPQDTVRAVSLTHSLTSHRQELEDAKNQVITGMGGGLNGFTLNITLPDANGVQRPVNIGRQPLEHAA